MFDALFHPFRSFVGVGMLRLPDGISSPFRLRIQAFGSEKGASLLDDIKVIGDICSTVTPPPVKDACDVLPCNFEGNTIAKERCANRNASNVVPLRSHLL